MAAHKELRKKLILAKKQKQNRPVPNWIRYRTGNTIKESDFTLFLFIFPFYWLHMVLRITIHIVDIHISASINEKVEIFSEFFVKSFDSTTPRDATGAVPRLVCKLLEPMSAQTVSMSGIMARFFPVYWAH